GGGGGGGGAGREGEGQGGAVVRGVAAQQGSDLGLHVGDVPEQVQEQVEAMAADVHQRPTPPSARTSRQDPSCPAPRANGVEVTALTASTRPNSAAARISWTR